jgi:spore coat polysaccharide biosynthesis predicted glycosyltransferase SpsG
VALGSNYKHDINEVFNCFKDSERAEIVVGNTFEDLWSFLAPCDLLILQGGLTTTEACHVGIPSINILRFEKQESVLRELITSGAVWLQNASRLEELGSLIERLMSSHSALSDASIIGKHMIDGKGAQRIARLLVDL